MTGVGPIGSSLNVVGFSGEIWVITKLPKTNCAALAAVVKPSEVKQAANNSFFIATPDRECVIQPPLTYKQKQLGILPNEALASVPDGGGAKPVAGSPRRRRRSDRAGTRRGRPPEKERPP